MDELVEKMPRLNFTTSYSKFADPLFSVIYESNKKNDTYYGDNVGNVFRFFVNDDWIFNAELIQVFKGRGEGLLDPFLDYNTDGKDAEIDNYLKMPKVLVLFFRKVIPYYVDVISGMKLKTSSKLNVVTNEGVEI